MIRGVSGIASCGGGMSDTGREKGRSAEVLSKPQTGRRSGCESKTGSPKEADQQLSDAMMGDWFTEAEEKI